MKGPAVVSLLVFTDDYRARGEAIAFADEAAARAWAAVFLGAFPRHAVYIVYGPAERLEAPPKKEGGAA